MPRVTPRTAIRAKVLRRAGVRDLVRRRRQRFTLAPVLPLPANRTFFFAVHRQPHYRTGKFVFRVHDNMAHPAPAHLRGKVSMRAQTSARRWTQALQCEGNVTTAKRGEAAL